MRVLKTDYDMVVYHWLMCWDVLISVLCVETCSAETYKLCTDVCGVYRQCVDICPGGQAEAMCGMFPSMLLWLTQLLTLLVGSSKGQLPSCNNSWGNDLEVVQPPSKDMPDISELSLWISTANQLSWVIGADGSTWPKYLDHLPHATVLC